MDIRASSLEYRNPIPRHGASGTLSQEIAGEIPIGVRLHPCPQSHATVLLGTDSLEFLLVHL